MRKLLLESLQVESFETTAGPHRIRGTVQGHADIPGTTIYPGTAVSECVKCQPWTINMGCGPDTYDLYNCGDTKYFDCTYGCTRNTCDGRVNSCGDVCWIEADTPRCAVE